MRDTPMRSRAELGGRTSNGHAGAKRAIRHAPASVPSPRRLTTACCRHWRRRRSSTHRQCSRTPGTALQSIRTPGSGRLTSGCIPPGSSPYARRSCTQAQGVGHRGALCSCRWHGSAPGATMASSRLRGGVQSRAGRGGCGAAGGALDATACSRCTRRDREASPTWQGAGSATRPANTTKHRRDVSEGPIAIGVCSAQRGARGKHRAAHGRLMLAHHVKLFLPIAPTRQQDSILGAGQERAAGIVRAWPDRVLRASLTRSDAAWREAHSREQLPRQQHEAARPCGQCGPCARSPCQACSVRAARPNALADLLLAPLPATLQCGAHTILAHAK